MSALHAELLYLIGVAMGAAIGFSVGFVMGRKGE